MKKKKKKLSSIVVTVIFLLQIFSSFTPLSSVKADGTDITNTFPFITGVSLTDGKGNPLGDDVPKDSDVRIQYDFSIPNTEKVTSGDTYTMQIPSQIAIVQPLTIPIKDDSGNNTIANVAIDKSGKVVITFTDYASTHSNVKGYFYVSANFDKSNIGNTNPVPIVFQLGGNSDPVTINVNFDQPAPLPTSVVKSGSYDASTNTITWSLKVNKENVAVNNGQLVDDIPIGQQYVDRSAAIDNGADASQFSYAEADPGDTAKTGTLTYKFPDTINKTYNVTFKTKVTDPNAFSAQGKSTEEYNTAVLKHDDTETISNKASVTVKSDYINKNGKYIDISSGSGPAAGQINWTIKVNNNALSLSNAEITDPIPQGLTLTPGSFKVDGKADNSFAYDGSTNILKYTFNGTINEPHIITFSTDVTDSNAYNSNTGKTYTNTVSMTGEGVPGTVSDSSNGVGVPTSVILKQGSGYNESTGEITWKVTVNSNRINIDNAVITDDIPTGQKYVDGSWSITPTDGHASSSGFSYTAAASDDKSKTGTLKYQFTGTINSTYTITFKTKVTDNTVFAANVSKNYYNTVTISGSNLPKPSSSTGKQAVTSEVINKSSTDYDYVTREITWTVVVNKNAMPIKDAVVTDVIDDGQDFVPGSVTINESPADSGNYTYDSSSKTFKYTLGDISSQQTITFKTKITDLSIFQTNGDKTVSNTSSLSGDIIPPGISSTGTRKITNKVIDKSGAYTAGQDYIDWTVNVNSNAIPLDSGSIKDTLQDGLQLDTSSVALKKMTLNTNGSLTPGDSVALTGSNIKYDTDRNFTFTFPGSIDGAYQLTFRTYITDPSKSPFTNTAAFSGSKADNQGSTSTQIDVYNGSGGGGSGETGSIKVVKVDSSSSQPLKGAVFQLIDQYGNPISKSSPTGSDGSTVFSKLRYDIDYSIKEITAPTGYDLSSEVYKFKISGSSDDKNIAYNFKDTKIVGNIQFNKTGQDGKGLQGAVFTLYNQDGKNPVKDSDGKDITAESNSGGLVEFKNIPYGKYVIKETQAPSGYNISTQTIDADLTAIKDNGQTIHALPYIVSNTRIMANIEFNKTDENSMGLQGAKFSLYESTDSDFSNPIATTSSDSNGLVQFKDVLVGTYKIKETQAPVGYNVNSQVLTATISQGDNENTITPTVDNSPVNTIIDSKIKATIRFTKTGEGGDANALEGAEFSLYSSIDPTKAIASATSDDNGIVQFDNVDYGSYYIKETKAPEGYMPLLMPLTVNVGKDDNGNTIDLGSVSDVKIKGNIQFYKVGEDGGTLAGAQFALYSGTDTTAAPVATATSDSRGLVEFTNVPYGTYSIKEIASPSAEYNINSRIFTATVNENGSTVKLADINDTKVRGGIEITKIDSSTSAPVPGATITVYNKDGSKVGSGVEGKTGKDGKVQFNNLTYGDYYFVETNAPEGYLLNTDKHPFSIKDNGVILKDTLPDIRITGGIEITKTDASTSAPVPGATITVYNKDGSKVGSGVEGKTGKDGKVQFNNLTYGDYYFVETSAPAGYLLNSDKHQFSIKDNGVVVKDSFTDIRITADIEITKIDTNGKVLPGAEFTLYKDGKAVDITVSDSNGRAKFQNVDYGTYTIKETKAPKGYKLNDSILNVDINSATIRKFTVKDEISPGNGGNSPGGDSNNPGGGSDVTPDTGKNNPVEGNPSSGPKDSYKSTGTGSILPKTGTMIDTTVLTIIGLLAILMGIVLAIRNRKLNK
ncbi:LPXTG cell wall anchor domain-containing protein [Clostridium tyrobutyricum]|uniref:SpaA isopeptide-forming pilin-related protein n=1 Tax=Clostridium tyrobutyricum TaxID=1519 RepID=UPI001C38C864|nr:SpaA isopeptide-forming pilin-related protein [Clostridium tyrobutyricum]MBV4417846.1 LPXTG cell wall anchor domain-containing protein [Clostridium tyrobutyricum]